MTECIKSSFSMQMSVKGARDARVQGMQGVQGFKGCKGHRDVGDTLGAKCARGARDTGV